MPLILASKSPRRKEILQSVGADFRIITKETDESYSGSPKPDELVKDLSLRKFRAVIGEAEEGDIVLAADTVVSLDGCIFGKPADRDEAFSMISRMSGRSHEVYTGIAVGDSEKVVSACECTKVFFRKLTKDEIYEYIDRFKVTDKAGAYAIQERAALFVEKIEGDFFNIVGLPVFLVGKILREMFQYEL